jgi:hypothetical protein
MPIPLIPKYMFIRQGHMIVISCTPFSPPRQFLALQIASVRLISDNSTAQQVIDSTFQMYRESSGSLDVFVIKRQFSVTIQRPLRL